MRKLGSATVLAILAAGGVQAGGIERIAPSTSILFEEGNYLELGWGYLSPDVSGEVITTVPQLGLVTGSKSGDMMGSYSLPSIAYKHDFGRGFSGALIYNQPYGANTLYDQADPDYFANLFGGQSAAHLSTNALTAILKYTTDSNISVYGGLRYQTMKASASVDFVGGYSVEADRTDGWGWLLGAAWEKPEIAARVALTYYSAIDHDFDKVHETGIYIGGPLAGQPYDVTTQTTVSIPQSIVLEFQSGVVEDTLVFGSIQWTNWSGDYKIAPEQYALVTGGSVLDDYENDSWTYNLGLSARAWAELLLLSLLWGGSFLAIRTALDEIGVFWAVAHRVGWAAAALWLYVLLFRLPLPRSPRVWGAFLVMGLLNNVIPFGLMAWGQLHIPTGLTAILNAATAIWGVLVAALVFADERLTARRALGVTLGFLGVATAIGPGALLALDLRSLAQLAVIAGTLSYALAGSWARATLSGLAPQVAAAGMLTGSSLVAIPAALFVEGPPALDLAPATLAAIAYYALAATALAYLLYYRVLAAAGSGNLLLCTLLIAPVAIVLGALVRDETLAPAAYAGFALLALGLLVLDGRLSARLRPSPPG
jgi:drug/metabolite transporter (DMT)-like permease/opacity protein-like surface antigen